MASKLVHHTMKKILQLTFAIGSVWLLPAAGPSCLAAQSSTNVVDSRLLEKQPELRKQPKLKLRKKGVTGEVVLRFIVNVEGEVENVMIVSFNDPDFVESAFQAYEEARFRPGLLNGQPVATWVEVKAIFPPK